MSDDDYSAGRHHFWIHFWFGLAFGAVVSFWVFGGVLEGSALFFGAVGASALLIAYACGRWGDPAWQRLCDWLRWL